jgi:hypothetical protein
MMRDLASKLDRRILLRLAAGVGLMTVLTSVHHVYGAIHYRTPWRLHVLPISIPVLLAIYALLFVSARRSPDRAGRIALGAALVLTMIVPVAVFGLFEGVYNHGLKDLLFFAGLPRSLMVILFPPPTYEMPNDLFFELSGLLQIATIPPMVSSAHELYRKHIGPGRRLAGLP